MGVCVALAIAGCADTPLAPDPAPTAGIASSSPRASVNSTVS
jgi:hypothetical protein